jgi:hypothetical protein
MILIVLFYLTMICDLYYNLLCRDSLLFLYLLVCMPNKMEFFFGSILFISILLFIILNISTLIMSQLELHKISVSFLTHLMLTNWHQNYPTIYTFLNHYSNMHDVYFLLIFFADDSKKMKIILLPLFVTTTLLNYNRHLLQLNIMDFLSFIGLVFFIYALLAF